MSFESFPGIKTMALGYLMDNELMDDAPKQALALHVPGEAEPDVIQLASTSNGGGTAAQTTGNEAMTAAADPQDPGGASADPPATAPDTPSPGATPHTYTFGTGARYTVDPYDRNGPRVDPIPLGELNAFKSDGGTGGAPPKNYPWQGAQGGRGASVPAMHPGLGESVKQFESQNGGVGTVSSGVNDPGGVSYGTYQFSSKDKKGTGGTMASFLRSEEGMPFQNEFRGMQPGSPEFSAKWKGIAANDPEGLHQAEKEFLYRTHFKDRAEDAARAGFDMSNPAIQDAIWSGSIQHGGFKLVVNDAVKSNDPTLLSADDQLKALYEARSRYADRQAVPVSAGRDRYRKELASALEYNRSYQDRKSRADYLWSDVPPPTRFNFKF